jgi:putative membrane protein
VPDDARPGSAARANAAVGVPDDRLPFVLLGWTYFSSVLANLVFFGRPAVALAGGLGMGAVLASGVLRTARSRWCRAARLSQGTPGRHPPGCPSKRAG